jgi:hypothetical protein
VRERKTGGRHLFYRKKNHLSPLFYDFCNLAMTIPPFFFHTRNKELNETKEEIKNEAFQ